MDGPMGIFPSEKSLEFQPRKPMDSSRFIPSWTFQVNRDTLKNTNSMIETSDVTKFNLQTGDVIWCNYITVVFFLPSKLENFPESHKFISKSQMDILVCDNRLVLALCRTNSLGLVVSHIFLYFPYNIWDNPSHWRTPSFFKMGTLHHQADYH